MEKRRGSVGVNIVICLVIAAAYIASSAGFSWAVNRNAAEPVFASREKGVAVELAVCGRCDAGEIAGACGELPVAVFLCGECIRLCPEVRYRLEEKGYTVGVYDCGCHPLPETAEGYVLMGEGSKYEGGGKLKYTFDATGMSEERIASLIRDGSLVKIDYTGAEQLKIILNNISKSGYNIVRLEKML